MLMNGWMGLTHEKAPSTAAGRYLRADIASTITPAAANYCISMVSSWRSVLKVSDAAEDEIAACWASTITGID
jgi:hypothetical protein